MNRVSTGVLIALLIGASTTRAEVTFPEADGYLFAPIDVPTAVGTVATGINDQGIIVGGFANGQHSDHWLQYFGGGYSTGGPGPGLLTQGFVLTNGTYIVNFPGLNGSFIYTGVNNNDRASITYDIGTLNGYTGQPPFNCISSPMHTCFPPNGATYLSVLGTNANGQVVGEYKAGITSAHGFLYTPGTGFTSADYGGGTTFTGINDAGQIVGYSNFDNACSADFLCRGFVISGGVVSSVSDPGSDVLQTIPHGINDTGAIVGEIGTGHTGGHGFIDVGGVFTQVDVPFPQTTGTEILGINDLGEIVGIYQDLSDHGNGTEHAFVASPLGLTQGLPLLTRTRDSQGRYIFQNILRGSWVDPNTASSYTYQMTGDSLFTAIADFPTGFDPFTVTSPDCDIPGQFVAGESLDFVVVCGHGVSEFTVSGIDPLVDPADPEGFPIELVFDTPTASFTADPESESASVSEPSSPALFLVGLFGFYLVRPASRAHRSGELRSRGGPGDSKPSPQF